MSGPSLVSVIIPTRGRASDATACVAAVLRCSDPFFEVILVDQNDDEETARLISPLIVDARLRHLRTPTRGAAAARNAGFEAAQGSLLVFTDDDCRVPPEWVTKMRARLEGGADVVCGRVTVPAELRSRGWAASFSAEMPDPEMTFPRGYDWGIAANMGLRRSVLERIGAFDAAFSPGAPLLAGEEPDFLIRALLAGLKIHNAPEIELQHLGVREGDSITRLRLGYVRGTAAALFKHARLGSPQARDFYLRLLARNARDVAGNLLHLRKPLGLRWLLAHVSGGLATLQYRVDEQSKLLVGWRTRTPVVPLRGK